MPCRAECATDTYSQNDVKAAEHRVRAELDPLLCEACTLLEEHKLLTASTPALQTWYRQHEECEKERVKYEAALKLNERERRLLGINLAALEAEMRKKKNKNK